MAIRLDDELERLAAEVQRQLQENRRFLERCLDEQLDQAAEVELAAGEDAAAEEEEEPFEEL